MNNLLGVFSILILFTIVLASSSIENVFATNVPWHPTNLAATAISSSKINLSWTAPWHNGGSAITGYKVQRSSNGGSTWSTIVSNTGSTSAKYSDNGLTASTGYTYRVSAINSVGTSSPSGTASATTLANTIITSSGLYIAIFSPQSVQSNLLNSQDLIKSFSKNVLSGYPVLLKDDLFFEVTDCNPPNGNDLSSAISTAKSFPLKSNNYVGYDPEGSNGGLSTCANELQQMGYYTTVASKTVHAAGYLFSIDPTWGEMINNYQSIDWTKVDMLGIQAQKHTSDPSFKSTITTESTFVHSKSPNTRIEIQVNPALDTIPNIINAIKSVKSQLYGVAIVCETTQGCTSTMLSHLITQLNSLS